MELFSLETLSGRLVTISGVMSDVGGSQTQCYSNVARQQVYQSHIPVPETAICARGESFADLPILDKGMTCVSQLGTVGECSANLNIWLGT